MIKSKKINTFSKRDPRFKDRTNAALIKIKLARQCKRENRLSNQIIHRQQNKKE